LHSEGLVVCLLLRDDGNPAEAAVFVCFTEFASGRVREASMKARWNCWRAAVHFPASSQEI